MARAADVFVQSVRESGAPYVLDFSPGSIAELDAMIATEWPPGERPSDQLISTMGAYVGEVLVRSLGGQWTELPEAPEPGVRVGEGIAFPISKVHKRVEFGDSHSIAHFVSELRAYAREGPARTRQWTEAAPPSPPAGEKTGRFFRRNR